MTAQSAITAFASNPSMGPVAIVDNTANVGRVLDELRVLAEAGAIASIKLTDNKTMTITGAQFVADAIVIAYLPTRQFIIVNDAPASLADTLQADAQVKSFRVTDSSPQVSARLDALNNDTKLIAITLTDTAPLAMTHTQLLGDTTVLAKLPAGTTYAVSSVSVAAAGSTQANAKVASFAVTDTAANVGADAGGLAGLSKLSAITVSDSGANIVAWVESLDGLTTLTQVVVTDTDTLTVTADTYLGHTDVWNALAPDERLTVTGALAIQAETIAANADVTGLTIVDTLANIGATLSQLDALPEAGRLTAITVTDSDATLTLTAAEQAAYQDAIALMSGAFTIAEPAPARPPVINLIWDESVAIAPTGFVAAIEHAAAIFDTLITNPITVNIEVGWGEARDTALGAGLLGEAYVMAGLFQSFTDYRAALSASNSSARIDMALAHLVDPGRQIFVAGAQGKALGIVAADAAATDGAIGFKELLKNKRCIIWASVRWSSSTRHGTRAA